jgi:hypothetical protein
MVTNPDLKKLERRLVEQFRQASESGARYKLPAIAAKLQEVRNTIAAQPSAWRGPLGR